MAFWKWSRTASSNATADNTINWAEGMAPSAVNDSARAMMARLAEWRDDVSGTITTGGTASAYTLASNQGFDNFADMNSAMIAFVPHATNGATVTLNVDGLGGKPLRFGPSLELQSGVLIQGTPYVVSYNNSDGAFYLQGGFANPYGIPLGGMMFYTGSVAPSSAFVFPFGQAISRATYATYFLLVGTTYGAGDGSTTFNVLDGRGRAVFGQDNMGGSAASRVTGAGSGITGTTIGAAGGNELMQQHTHGVTDPGHTHSGPTAVVGYQNGANLPPFQPTGGGGNVNTNSATTGISINNAGAGGSQNMPPAIVLPYILRII
jgi:microcystin-dependent protein